MKLGQYDVYLNVAGGMKIAEPAADLAAAAALVSSLTGASLPRDAVYFGEIALSGSVRAVAHPGLRLKEAAKLGFAESVRAGFAARGQRGRQDRREPYRFGGDAGRAHCGGRSRNEVGTRRRSARGGVTN